MITKTCPICTDSFTTTRDAATCPKPACRKAYQRAKSTTLEKPATPIDILVPDYQVPDSKILKATLESKQKANKAPTKPQKDLGYSIMSFADLPETTFIPTGFPELDAIIKGFPRRRVTEIYGPPSVGKTSLMLATTSLMDLDLRILYLDLENAISKSWMETFGITQNAINIKFANPFLLEEAAQLVLDSIADYDLIVFDSVGSALYKTEDVNEFGTANVGVKAKLMTQFMRKLIGPLARTTCAVVFVNQEKPSIGDMYAPKWYTPGGKALEYASSLRLRLTSNKSDRIVKDGNKVGKKVHAEVTKNKVGRPDTDASFLIYY